MPGLLTEYSSLALQHENLEGSMSLEEDMSLDERSQGSLASPHVPYVLPAAFHKPGFNVGSGLLDPDHLNKNTGTDIRLAIAERGRQVPQKSVFTSDDDHNYLRVFKASTDLPVTNGVTEVECEERISQMNGNIEDKDSLVAPDAKVARHPEDGNATQAAVDFLTLNSKKNTASASRFQTKFKGLEKHKLPSPKPAVSNGKNPENARDVSAMRAKDGEKRSVDLLILPSPETSRKPENGKILSSVAPQEKAKGRKNVQNAIKMTDKTKPLSPTSTGTRLAPIVEKAPDSSNFLAEISKYTDEASPNRLTSPNKSDTKVSLPSLRKPFRMTPPSLSERSISSVNKVSPRKPSSHPGFSESPASSNISMLKNISLDQERLPLESEKVNQKSLLKRRSGAGMKFGDTESIASSVCSNLLTRENPDLGPYLLKLARQAIISGDNPRKALDYAGRAAKSYEIAVDEKSSLNLVMSLHILAATHCTLGQFEEAIPVLQHSIAVTDIEAEKQDCALATFAGNMQLGDTYSLLGRCNDALAAYHVGLEIQKNALGEMDPRVGETCRYLAEAHAQALQFDEAEALCQLALDVHQKHSAPASIEEATDRRLMGLICNGKGKHEAALEHLVLASMALIANGKNVDVAAVDTSIGDTYACLGRFDEAVFSYQKALTVFKATRGESHVAVASVYVSLAQLYLKTGKVRECKTYCNIASRIFNKQGVGTTEEVVSGLTELAVVFEALDEREQALLLLKKALSILDGTPGQQSSVAGVEAQLGVLNFMSGNHMDARSSLKNAVSKLRGSGEKTSALFGIVLNQMGLCCLHLSEIKMAAQLFQESRSIMEIACGPHHPDTLTVCSNLAGAYDALGRLDDAIGVLQYVVEVHEEELGTANLEVEDERRRLAELLREAGRLRARRLNNTFGLLINPEPKQSILSTPGQNVAAGSVSVK